VGGEVFKRGGRTVLALTVFYPERGNAFYRGLANRLASAAAEARGASEVRCLPYADLLSPSARSLEGDDFLLVNPREWLLTSTSLRFPDLDLAQRRILVLAEAVETPWYAGQFELGIAFDAVFDVGFVSQSQKKSAYGDVPYAFVFNAATASERSRIDALHFDTARPISWSVIGHYTADRARLVAELVEAVGPGGVAFLPPLRPVRAGEGLLSPRDVSRILGASRLYVWRSHHRFPYYESFRFIDALLAGAVPCKIGDHPAELGNIPAIFEDVRELAGVARNDAASLYEEAKDFYLTAGRLSDHLEAAYANLS
jgi:hypothetical protein